MTTSRARRTLRVAAATLAVGVALTTAGCTQVDRPHEPGMTVVVVGNRSNQPLPALTDKARSLIQDAIESQDTIYFFDVSGHPTLQGKLSTKTGCNSKNACNGPWTSFASQVTAAVTHVKPGGPEADLLGALTLAGRQLSTASGPKHLLVIDSGVQTTGDLPLQAPGVLDVDPASITNSLKANQTLPDLHGVDVLVTGLGYGHPPQPPIQPKTLDQLSALWKAVFLASGADPGSYDDDQSVPADTAPEAGLPTVTPVPFTPKQAPKGPVCDFSIRADQIGFVADQATFVDEAKARAVLAPIAKTLVTDGGNVTLTGTTAVPETNPTSPDRLSVQRAQAVEQLLIGLNVPASLITEINGVGTNFKGFVKDTNDKGQLVEALAIQNRLVLIHTSSCSK